MWTKIGSVDAERDCGHWDRVWMGSMSMEGVSVWTGSQSVGGDRVWMGSMSMEGVSVWMGTESVDGVGQRASAQSEIRSSLRDPRLTLTSVSRGAPFRSQREPLTKVWLW